MRFFVYLFLVSLMIPSALSASYIYIKATATTSPKQVKSMKSKIRSLGSNSTHISTKNRYIIYAGPYKNSKSAKYNLKKLKKYFPHAVVVKVKKPINKRSSRKKVNYAKKERKPEARRALPTTSKNNYFVGAALGYSSTPLIHNGNVDLYLPKSTGISYDINGGLNLQKNFFLTAGYLRSDATDIVFDNIYASINYSFLQFDKFTPYAGLVAGYSTITWNRNPITNTTNEASNSSSSSFGGTQIGIIYDGFKDFSLYSNYQCLFMRHNTVVYLDDTASNLEHKTLHNLQFGARYNF